MDIYDLYLTKKRKKHEPGRHLLTGDQILDLMEEDFKTEYSVDVKTVARTKFDQNKAYADIASPIKYNGPYMWITLNPMEHILPEMIMKKAHKAFKKRWITHSVYSLEQRSEELPYKGFHVHCVLHKGDKIPSEASRELKSTFNTICDTSNPHCLHIRYLDHDSAKDKVAYLMGLKRSEKLAKVNLDKQMRSDYGYPDYWTVNAVPQSLLEPLNN